MEKRVNAIEEHVGPCDKLVKNSLEKKVKILKNILIVQICEKNILSETAEPDYNQIRRNAVPGNHLFNGGGFLIMTDRGSIYNYYQFQPTNGDGFVFFVKFQIN